MRSKTQTTFLLALLITVAESASDIYAPSLPKIKDFFAITEAQASLTMSMNLLGISLSSLIYGPLSDQYGRRKIILLGWTIFTLGSFASAFASSIGYLIIARFIQGLGGGAALVVSIAIIRDIYDNSSCARVISAIGMVISLSPAIGPVVGGIIAAHYGWQVIFWLIHLLALILLVITFISLPETKVFSQEKFKILSLGSNYFELCKNFRFLGYGFIALLTFFWLWGEIGNLPFIFMQGMGLEVKDYGYFITFTVGVYLIGALFNQSYVEKVGVERMLKFGLILVIISSIITNLGNLFIIMTPWKIQLCKIPASFGLAFILGNCMSLALENSGKHTGTGASFVSALEMIGGGLGIYIIGKFYDGTIFPVAICTFIASIMSLLIFLSLQKEPMKASLGKESLR